MIDLFHSNNTTVIFSKAEKHHITGTIHLKRQHKSGVGGLKICQVLEDFFFLLNKRSIVLFCRWRGLAVTKLVIQLVKII